MKSLGVDQMLKKKFVFYELTGEWSRFIGKMARGIVGCIYGEPGQGKTELCLRMAKEFCKLGKVHWISYEQGHDYDLQFALDRNKMHEVSGKFTCINPNTADDNKSKFEHLKAYLEKRSSAEFIFIDSIDYINITIDEYKYLKEKLLKNKCIFFISHEKNGQPKSKTGNEVAYDGKLVIRVNKCIAYNKKNRLSGKGEYIIFEETARKLNPLYFKKLENENLHSDK
jgi:Ni2+-binding GTPase involved in maturation of urease and hydrogenase